MKQVVIKCGDHLLESWVTNMTRLLPDSEFQVLPYNSSEIVSKDVKYVIGWRPDAHWVNQFSNIRALVSIGSGVDHIINLEDLRSDIPVIRTVSPDLIQRMREYVAMCVLAWHRQLIPILEANETHRWDRFAVGTSSDIHVGIMGYGSMGKASAETLAALGYQVSIWAKSARTKEPFPYFHGDEALAEFARNCDVVVCLLPLTTETENILNYEFMSLMKPGGCLINAARGGHLVDEDVIKATSDGTLSMAFLDGLREEPMGPESPLWDAPNVVITCHSAAYISPEAGPRIIAENIRKFDAGKPVGPMYDQSKGF